MSMFHRLFGKAKAEGYLAHLRDAVEEDLAELGSMGTFEVFSHMKLLVHRLAFRSWAGKEAASPRYLKRLVALFEQLDPEEAFVLPGRTIATVLTGKVPEKRALREVERILGEIWDLRAREGRREGDMLEALHESYAALPESERGTRVACDVMILHLASLSNLYAALSWTLVNLLLRPDLLARVRAGDDELLERCAHESIRMAQRSITLRKVVAPCTVDDGQTTYHLRPGVFVATMLSVNNTAFPGLERFDPSLYDRGRLAPRVPLPTPEVVSTFGHGQHACPGQRFAIAAIRVALRGFLDALELDPQFSWAEPKRGQIGAVARAADPCPVRYRRRATVLSNETVRPAVA
jgi:cytochrome P450